MLSRLPSFVHSDSQDPHSCSFPPFKTQVGFLGAAQGGLDGCPVLYLPGVWYLVGTHEAFVYRLTG